MAGTIHVGIGGWDFDPWRGTFYPEGLPKAKQLAHLGTRLSATEINATFYKLQSPELFERWGAMVPDGFKFAIKASRFCTNRKQLGERGRRSDGFAPRLHRARRQARPIYGSSRDQDVRRGRDAATF